MTSNPVDETRVADPVERKKRQRHSDAKKAAEKAGSPKQQRRRKIAAGSHNDTKPANGKQIKQQTCLDLLGRRGRNFPRRQNRENLLVNMESKDP
jgi:hypothetical protein